MNMEKIGIHLIRIIRCAIYMFNKIVGFYESETKGTKINCKFSWNGYPFYAVKFVYYE